MKEKYEWIIEYAIVLIMGLIIGFLAGHKMGQGNVWMWLK